MARKLKATDAAERAGIKVTELRKVVTAINRFKKAASESSGLAGKETQTAAEAHGLDKGALTLCCRLDKQETAKRQAFMRSFLDYADKLGFFNEIDAFDDTLGILKDIVARASEREGDRPELPKEVTSLLDGEAHGTA